MNYYNEHDKKAAAWIRELIKAGVIAPGEVDERSIVDVKANELVGYTQCHFFAGIGGWSYALRLAGWADDRAVWTGSCPCQPFSCAGEKKGVDDIRHLWPEFFRLIATCKPDIVFGEQVASAEVMGHVNEGVYGVQGGQTTRTVQNIFRQREAREASFMQRLPTEIRKEVEIKQHGIQTAAKGKEIEEGHVMCTGIPDKKSGKLPCGRVPSEVQEKKLAIRSRSAHGEIISENECGILRINGITIQSETAKKTPIQQSLFRQDCTGEGLYLRECSHCACCRQYDDRELGVRNSDTSGNGSSEQRGDVDDSQRTTTGANNGQHDEADRFVWIDGVFADLESAGYACAALDIPAASVGAPHIRQRFFWVADTEHDGQHRPQGTEAKQESNGENRGIHCGSPCGVGNTVSAGLQGHAGNIVDRNEPGRIGTLTDRPVAQAGRDCWSEYIIIPCGDGKARRIKPGIAPLVDGIPERVGLLRGYGNAIVPEAAAEFIRAFGVQRKGKGQADYQT